jgi:hypothetical protein
MVDATTVHAWLVAQALRIAAGSTIGKATSLPDG